MLLTVQSLTQPDFFVKIKPEVVAQVSKYYIFELANFEDDITITVKGTPVNKTRQIAIAENSNGLSAYIVNSYNRIRRFGHVGPCLIEKTGRPS